ncbi:hypothetical protein [Streptomyces sp. SID3343]|nr:hypothetical protein [Streptomyces sp. SID3343]
MPTALRWPTASKSYTSAAETTADTTVENLIGALDNAEAAL